MSFISPQWMLLSGIVISLLNKNENIKRKSNFLSTKLLQISVILLGASLNFNAVIHQGLEGALVTFISILVVFILGIWGRNLFKIDKIQGLLITAGTAICGGSAIGALAPILQAGPTTIAISVGVVFLLNALAVFIFPFVGGLFELGQEQFGLWAALAIHDTSSVVAAASIYGEKALEIATTVKLTRALWIIPLSLIFSFQIKHQTRKISFPWFILGFLGLSLFFTFFEVPDELRNYTVLAAKLGFSFTLFFIGLTFNLKTLKAVGIKPLAFGVLLWLIISVSFLFLIKQNILT